MRFALVDRIVSLERGESISTVKNLSLAEEYLADHFPGFPVLPGVLMLEALVQTVLGRDQTVGHDALGFIAHAREDLGQGGRGWVDRCPFVVPAAPGSVGRGGQGASGGVSW